MKCVTAPGRCLVPMVMMTTSQWPASWNEAARTRVLLFRHVAASVKSETWASLLSISVSTSKSSLQMESRRIANAEAVPTSPTPTIAMRCAIVAGDGCWAGRDGRSDEQVLSIVEDSSMQARVVRDERLASGDTSLHQLDDRCLPLHHECVTDMSGTMNIPISHHRLAASAL
jgi:hypothetical protein